MRQVLGRCKPLKANDKVAYFKALAMQQMPKKMAHPEKMNINKSF
jgi:hypothetical protein